MKEGEVDAYIKAAQKQNKEAATFVRRAIIAQADDWRASADPIDRALAARPDRVTGLSLVPDACANTLAVLRSFPREQLKAVTHGARFTMTVMRATGELAPGDEVSNETEHLFVDADVLPGLSLAQVNGSKRALAKIPGVPNFMLSDTLAGRSLKGKRGGEDAPYEDLDGNRWVVKVTSVE